MRSTDVVIIGAGHSGLAMSAVLRRHRVAHAVLERAQPGAAWRHERWDSLRLLTPNWLCRLPGLHYAGDDPHGYLSAVGVADFITGYARHIDAPVHAGTTVLRVTAADPGYLVRTDHGDWACRALVLASGACRRAAIPGRRADAVPPEVRQGDATTYRRPSMLDPGPVLVVGASATGLQLAQELSDSGRRVLLACGEHVRMPRTYRGRDVQWWLHACGVLDQRIESMDDPVRARALPSPQLAGGRPPATLDLNTVQDRGVEVCGRLAGVQDGRAVFSGSLRNVCALADLKMQRMLDGFDRWAGEHGIDPLVEPAGRFAPTAVPAPARLSVELGREVRSIVWATGYRPDFDWLDLPVFDRRGALMHDRGIVPSPGLVVLGLPFLRRRKSSFIHGAEDDAVELGQHLFEHLERGARQRLRNRPTLGSMPAAATTTTAATTTGGPARSGGAPGAADSARCGRTGRR